MLKWFLTAGIGPVAQLGARFHGMEEVDGSNPSRSTTTFHRLTSLDALKTPPGFTRLRSPIDVAIFSRRLFFQITPHSRHVSSKLLIQHGISMLCSSKKQIG